MFFRAAHISATGTGTIGGTNSSTVLGAVNVNTGAASAVLTLKEGSSAGATIAVIDASSARGLLFFSVHKDGVYWDLTGGNADITISFS